MSRLKRDIRGQKLRNLLARADDEAFLQMMWAVDALQSDRVSVAKKYIQFPASAATSDIAAPVAIHSWELETLVNQLLVTPKLKLSAGRNRFLDCSKFGSTATAVSFLRGIEDAEAGIYLRHYPVLNELHRIGQRIFPWQRGYFNIPNFYRSAFIYGQGKCAEYFQTNSGLTIDELSLIGFGLRAYLQDNSHLQNFSMENVGIAPGTMDAALKLLAVPVEVARTKAASLAKLVSDKHRHLPIAYRSSFLRKFPIISFGKSNERLRSPLPELILLRVTSGLYYDLVSGGSDLRNEAADRFEGYCHKFLAAMLPNFEISRSHQYKFRSNSVDSPDLLVRKSGAVVLVLECKATKLTFGAQFANDPIGEASAGYDELAKGIFQIWRYFSHARRGIISIEILPDAHGIILTLDMWLLLSNELQDELIEKAKILASKDPEIKAADQRRIIFCAVQDLESVLMRSDEGRFLSAVSAATEDRFVGWQLPNIHSEIGNDTAAIKPYPFDPDEILPSWKRLKKMGDEQKLKSVTP